MHQFALNFRRQDFQPRLIITAQCNIQCEDIFHFAAVDRVIADGGTGGHKAVQESIRPSLASHSKKAPSALSKKVLSQLRASSIPSPAIFSIR